MDSKQAQAQRYAQAVYEAMLEQWQSALNEVQAVLSKDQALYASLTDGSKDFNERLKALEAALPKKGFPVEIKNLLSLLLQNGNLELLSDVSAALGRIVSGQQAPTKAEVTSAAELSEQEKDALRQSLAKQFGAGLTFSFHVDPALMGGLRVRVGDSLIDTSVASRLSALRESLASAVR
ncbi:MAG: ATP synthase F1 subunit delta [Caldilineaceae bacterium]|nr:ATP synthase F1 subunit delta [Caldilineaceae bacterium]